MGSETVGKRSRSRRLRAQPLLSRVLGALEDSALPQSVRDAVALSATRLGAREAAPYLVSLLERPDDAFGDAVDPVTGLPSCSEARIAAVEGLGTLGRGAPGIENGVALLLRIVREREGGLQLSAAEALVALGERGPGLEDTLLEAIAASGAGAAWLLPLLARLLPRRIESMRELVKAFARGEAYGWDPRESLWEATRDRPEALAHLEALARDADPAVRSASERVLHELGILTEPSREGLLLRLLGANEAEREGAVRTLRRFGTKAEGLLPRLVAEGSGAAPGARAAMLSVLGALAGGRLEGAARAALVAGLEDADERVREAAALALGDFAAVDVEVRERIAALLGDEAAGVREAVREVLGGPGDGPSFATGPEVDPVAATSRRFGFGLYHALREKRGNLVFSPLSVFTLLAITLRGTRGPTEQALQRALGWTAGPERLASAVRALAERLEPQSSDETFALASASGFWFQEGYPIRPAFLAELEASFGATPASLDFARTPEAAADAVNGWIDRHTRGRIQALVAPGELGQATRFVLANAVSFRARWKDPFPDELTEPRPFRLLDGTQVAVPRMRKSAAELRYGRGPGYQLLELPYRGEQVSMLVLLPDEGLLARCERLLRESRVEALLARLEPGYFVVELPRFSFGSGLDLNDVAERLGFGALLRPDADLSGLTPAREVGGGRLKHEAHITVDEKGTEAMAATLLAHIGGVPSRVVIDRPFLFLVRHRETGAVLFMGRVLDPRA